MALVNTHTDYMNFYGDRLNNEEYPVSFFIEFIEHVQKKYKDQYYQSLPGQLSAFWKKNIINKIDTTDCNYKTHEIH